MSIVGSVAEPLEVSEMENTNVLIRQLTKSISGFFFVQSSYIISCYDNIIVINFGPVVI